MFHRNSKTPSPLDPLSSRPLRLRKRQRSAHLPRPHPHQQPQRHQNIRPAVDVHGAGLSADFEEKCGLGGERGEFCGWGACWVYGGVVGEGVGGEGGFVENLLPIPRPLLPKNNNPQTTRHPQPSLHPPPLRPRHHGTHLHDLQILPLPIQSLPRRRAPIRPGHSRFYPLEVGGTIKYYRRGWREFVLTGIGLDIVEIGVLYF